MAKLLSLLIKASCFQPCRNATRVRISTNYPSYYPRRRLEAATERILPMDLRPKSEKCKMISYNAAAYDFYSKRSAPDELSEITFQNFLSKKLRRLFHECKFIVFVLFLHGNERMQRKLKFDIHSNAFKLIKINFFVAAKALQGTKFHPLVNLFQRKVSIMLHEELNPTLISSLLKNNKQIILPMLALLDNSSCITGPQLMQLLKVKSISNLHQELSSILTSSSSSLLSLTAQPGKDLAFCLKSHLTQTR